MTITIRKLHPLSAAEITGIDTGEELDDATIAQVRAAFEEYSVLPLCNQSLDDENQIGFSRRFGVLGPTIVRPAQYELAAE